MSGAILQMPLTKVESKQFDALETTIQEGLVTFYEVGSALKEIRDSKLYREVFSRFEDYCREKWGLEKSHTYRLIDCCELRQNLSPIGEVFPANEAQARPLTKLEPEQQREAWQQVLDSAPETEDGHKLITAKVVSEVVGLINGDDPNVEPAPFDRDDEGDKLCDSLRGRLDRWPEDLRSEAAHWIREILREYQLGTSEDETLKARIEELEERNTELNEKLTQIAQADDDVTDPEQADIETGNPMSGTCPMCGLSDQVVILPRRNDAGKQYVEQCDRCENIIRFIPQKEAKTLLKKQEADQLLAAVN